VKRASSGGLWAIGWPKKQKPLSCALAWKSELVSHCNTCVALLN
jgi:hypothetical protein